VWCGHVLDADSQQFVIDVMRRKDRANDGMTRRDGIDMVQDLKPSLKRKQAERAFDRHVRAKSKDVLTGIVKANKSTEKRCAITVPQQFRWHQVRFHLCISHLRPHTISRTRARETASCDMRLCALTHLVRLERRRPSTRPSLSCASRTRDSCRAARALAR
jgi:hypothetical protein